MLSRVFKIRNAFLFQFVLLSASAMATDSIQTQKKETTSFESNYRLFNFTQTSLNYSFNEDLRKDAEWRSTVIFDYYGNSNAAPSGMLMRLLTKRPITRPIIDRTDNRIKNKLKFEDFMKTGYTLHKYLKKADATFIVGWNHRQMRYLNAERDLFETVFYGNARFEGDTAQLNDLRFYNYIYNQYSLGVKKKFYYPKYQMQFGFLFSFLQVINQQEIRTGENTTLYTAPDGEYININYDLTFNSAKEGATKFGDLNGLGPSGDLNVSFMNNNKWKFCIDISDVGFLKMKKNPVNYSAAKNITFNGIVIPDLLHFTSATFDTLNLDSAVRSYLPAKSANEYTLFLPFSVSAVFSKPMMKNRLVLNAGLMYRYLPGYNVYGFVKANYFIRPDMVFSASAGAGGYSVFNLGVEFCKSFKYFDLTFGTSNLPGLIVPSHLPGNSVYLRLGSMY